MLKDLAARAGETRIFLGVYHPGSATTPLTTDARAQFASYVAAIVRDVPSIGDVIVGNEPNLNRFWLPQFDEAGNDVAAPAYFALLAEVYDAAKEADEDVRIWGGALAPRGIDRPGTGRDTHSPTTFIRDLGAAYRASGRDEPPLDGFAFHPYPASSSIPPDRPTDPASKSILMADYEEKLRPLLDEAFGPGLPVLYSELGVETGSRRARRRSTRGPSRASRSTKRPRPTTTAARSSSPPARRTSSACCSSTRTTSRRSPASSPASTTSTGRRRRASSPCVTRFASAGVLSTMSA